MKSFPSSAGHESIKVIYVVTRMIVGGAQETTNDIADHFAQKRWEVLLITGPQSGREGYLAPTVQTHQLRSLKRELDLPSDLEALLQLYRLFKNHRPDIVHAATAKARFIAALAGRAAGIPNLVQTVHGFSFNNEFSRFQPLYIILEWLLSRLYHRTIFVSQSDLSQGQRLRLTVPRKTRLMRPGLDRQKIMSCDLEAAEDLRRRYGPKGERIVTLLGRLSSPKTPEVFVRAADEILRTHPGTTFLIVGDGHKREEVENLVEELRLQDRVFLLGLRTDVGEILAASDIVVHSSTHEGLPKTVLEAMAAGKPVVATRVGGVPEVVEDMVTGLLVDKCDPGQLAAAVQKLLEDPELGNQLVSNARKILPEFSLDKTLEQTEQLYEELLGQTRRRRALARVK